jgi:hypothetical protein
MEIVNVIYVLSLPRVMNRGVLAEFAVEVFRVSFMLNWAGVF